MKMKPFEMIVGQQVGAVSVVPYTIEGMSEVECFNGLTKKSTYFVTTDENGRAISKWLEAGRPGMIQEALPQLTADEREQCLSGITPQEWDAMFSEEEADTPYGHHNKRIG